MEIRFVLEELNEKSHFFVFLFKHLYWVLYVYT